uniref:CSON005097 protein n=1 Tax=Culicoides sonorensis TaxID=179676 RepID=A0A336M6M3_CULSO
MEEINLIITITPRFKEILYQIAPLSKEKLQKIKGIECGKLVEGSQKPKSNVKVNLFWSKSFVVFETKDVNKKIVKPEPKTVSSVEQVDVPPVKLESNCVIKEEPVEDFLETSLGDQAEPQTFEPDHNQDDFIKKSDSESDYEIPEWCKPTPVIPKKVEKIEGNKKSIKTATTLCHICSQEVNLYTFKAHLLKHENGDEKPFRCNECGKGTSSIHSLKEHLIQKHFQSLAEFACDKCPKKFMKKSRLERHLSRTHQIGQSLAVTCPHCNTTLKSASILKAHIFAVHTDPELKQKFPCEQCSKIFFKKIHYKTHLLTHLPEDQWPFECETCGQKFKHSQRYKRHVQQHENPGAGLIFCNLCGKGFKFAHILNIHMRTHTGEKPFECKFCQKRFADPSNYRNHMKHHENEMGVKLTLSFEEKRLVHHKVLDQKLLIGAKKVMNDTN